MKGRSVSSTEMTSRESRPNPSGLSTVFAMKGGRSEYTEAFLGSFIWKGCSTFVYPGYPGRVGYPVPGSRDYNEQYILVPVIATVLLYTCLRLRCEDENAKMRKLPENLNKFETTFSLSCISHSDLFHYCTGRSS